MERISAPPSDFAESPVARIMKQPLLLGLFLPIQSGGWSPSTLPRTTSWEFDYNASLTQRAEEFGFDLAFGLAQWTGKGGIGGEMRFRELSLDPFITVTSLATITKRIILISTRSHPLRAVASIVSREIRRHDRSHLGWPLGTNVVTGFVPSEARMFGNEQIQHDMRYEMAAEFTGMMTALWSSPDNLSMTGRYWKLVDAYVTPKPRFSRPLLVNATGSPAGIAYAARYSDLVFITSPGGGHFDAAVAALPKLNGDIKAKATEFGRQVRTIINPMVVAAPTERQAREYYDAIVGAADWGAIDKYMGRRAAGDAQGWKTDPGNYRAVGGNLQIVGSPNQVVEAFVQLQKAGCDGVQLTFFDFARDLEFFGKEIVPLMKEARLRL